MPIEALLRIIKEAIKQVPSLKYAFGVLALVSIVAIASSMKLDYRVTVFGVIFVIIMAAVVLLFSRLSQLAAGHFKAPAIILLWFSLLVSIVVPSLLVSSVFFKAPLDLSQYITEFDKSLIQSEDVDNEDTASSDEIDGSKFSDINLSGFGSIKFVDSWNGNLVAGFATPNQIVMFDDEKLSNSQIITINGSPITFARDDRYLYLATEYPSSIQKIDLLLKKVTETFVLPTDKTAFPLLENEIDGQLPSEIRSVALSGKNLWVAVSDNSSAVLYALNLDAGKYSVPKYYDHNIAFDARGWKLVSIGQKVYAATTNSVPSSLIRLEEDSYVVYGGHDYDIVSSLTNIWETSTGSLSFVDSQNQVVGVSVSDSAITPIAKIGDLGDLGKANWVDPVVVVEGGRIYMAINERAQSSQKNLWATIVEIENGVVNKLGMLVDSRIIDMTYFKSRLFLIAEGTDHARRVYFAEDK